MDGGLGAGGSLTLADLIDRYGAIIYADLLRYYQVDISTLVSDTPEITPKQALALIENLPSESKTLAYISGAPSSYGWGTTAYLLAGVIDTVRENTHTNIQVRTKKRIKPFDRFPIPGSEKKEKPVNMFVQMAQQQFANSGGEF